MDRRDALKALTSLATTAGMTVTPITTHEASTDVALLIFKAPGYIEDEHVNRLIQLVDQGLKGTPLEGVKAIVLGDGMDLEIVRKLET